jgi:hypothetical protein
MELFFSPLSLSLWAGEAVNFSLFCSNFSDNYRSMSDEAGAGWNSNKQGLTSTAHHKCKQVLDIRWEEHYVHDIHLQQATQKVFHFCNGGER